MAFFFGMDDKDLQIEKARIYAVLQTRMLDVVVNDLAVLNCRAAKANPETLDARVVPLPPQGDKTP